MFENQRHNSSGVISLSPNQQLAISRFQSKTYGWMCLGLFITGMISYMIAGSEQAIRFIFSNKAVFYAILIGELALVMGLSAVQRKLSAGAALLGFLAYSALNGVTFSVIFLAYTMESISQVFMLSAGMFGGLAVFGAVTKKDLHGVGSFVAMGLWGIILIGLINIFVGSEALNFGLGVAGVLIFSGLTAYESQRIRYLALEFANGSPGSSEESKASIYGALSMYLNFINLFLSLLRIFGRRR